MPTRLSRPCAPASWTGTRSASAPSPKFAKYWKKPAPRADADELRAADLPIYVHSPYLINVCADDNRVRIPSRKILQDTCDAAAEIGAEAVVVHGGHVTGDGAEHFGRSAHHHQVVNDLVLFDASAAAGHRRLHGQAQSVC